MRSSTIFRRSSMGVDWVMALPMRKDSAATCMQPRHGRKQTVCLDIGTATNNEGECRTLIAALKDLTGRIQKAGRSPPNCSVLVYTDSQLMIGRKLTTGDRRTPVSACPTTL
jgi:ribonuclease HI